MPELFSETESLGTKQNPDMPNKVLTDLEKLDLKRQTLAYQFIRKFSEINSQDPEYLNNKELIRRQRRLLAHLPFDFIDQLTAHLKASYIENNKYSKFEPNRSYDASIIRGEIFERLVEMEDDRYHLDPDWQKHPQSIEQKMVAQRILALMANPERYGYDASPVRNPDLIMLIFRKGKFVIDAWVEAKKHLDYRTLLQLKNFRRSIQETANSLNNTEDAEEHGLIGMGKNKHKITVSNTSYQIIAIPRAVEIEDHPGKKTKFIDYNMSQTSRDELIRLLHDTEQVRVVRSSFSFEELEIIAEYFLKEINKKLEMELETKAT